MHWILMVDSIVRHNDKHARESIIIVVRDVLSAPTVDHNLILVFAMKEADINVRIATKF